MLQGFSIQEYFTNGYVVCFISFFTLYLQLLFTQQNFFLSIREGIRCKCALQVSIVSLLLYIPSSFTMGVGPIVAVSVTVTNRSYNDHCVIQPLSSLLLINYLLLLKGRGRIVKAQPFTQKNQIERILLCQIDRLTFVMAK